MEFIGTDSVIKHEFKFFWVNKGRSNDCYFKKKGGA